MSEADPSAPSASAKGSTGVFVNPLAHGVLKYDRSHGSEVLASFFSEVGGHLENIEHHLLKLEAHPADREALNAVFGAMHSLKGIAGFLDLTVMQGLAHISETVMERARKRSTGIRPPECDAVFKAVDLFREIASSLSAHAQAPEKPLPSVPVTCALVMDELLELTRAHLDDKPAHGAGPRASGAAAAKGERQAARSTLHSGLVRVQVDKLDSLLDAVGELVVIQSQVSQDPALEGLQAPRLKGNLAQLGKIVRGLQSVALTMRMHPLRDTFARMARLIRDIARKEQKEVDVSVSGENTEMDKNVIECLVDPLTHLVHNAIDHGIDVPERRTAQGKLPRGRIALSARHQGGNVVIEVSDDGRGLDLERILKRGRQRGLVGPAETPGEARIRSLIFEPGFSTVESATNLSGRGVGLDVVKRSLEALGGSVSVDSKPGRSTAFSMSAPLTLAIMDGLLVRTGSGRYIVPIANVVESLQPQAGQICTIHERGEVLQFRGAHVPLVRLHEFTGDPPDSRDPCRGIVMAIDCGGERCALLVDELLGQQQVVIKNLGAGLRAVKGYLGGAVLGDGRVGLILDLAEVLFKVQGSKFKADVA